MLQHELKLDFDWTPPLAWVQTKVGCIVTILGEQNVAYACREPSHSRGFHLRIGLVEPVSDELAVKLQWLFGDDQTRARLNWQRVQAGVTHWNKLFDHKVEKK